MYEMHEVEHTGLHYVVVDGKLEMNFEDMFIGVFQWATRDGRYPIITNGMFWWAVHNVQDVKIRKTPRGDIAGCPYHLVLMAVTSVASRLGMLISRGTFARISSHFKLVERLAQAKGLKCDDMFRAMSELQPYFDDAS